MSADRLLGGSARCGDGGTKSGRIDAQNASQERQRAQVRLSDALPESVDGPRVEPVQGSPGGQAETVLRQVGGQQVVQGLGGGALACHARTNSRQRQEKQSPPLDIVGQIADASDVENSPDCRAAFYGSAAAEARPEPREEPAMKNATALFDPAQLEAELRNGTPETDPARKWEVADGPVLYSAGIVVQTSPSGDEILHAQVYDAQEFRNEHDAPVTDERAEAIAHRHWSTLFEPKWEREQRAWLRAWGE